MSRDPPAGQLALDLEHVDENNETFEAWMERMNDPAWNPQMQGEAYDPPVRKRRRRSPHPPPPRRDR